MTLSRQNPVLMIFEDAHWIDPSSLELFGRIVDIIPTLRVLLIVTFRPEFKAPRIGCNEAKQIAKRLLGAPRSLHRLIALSHGVVHRCLAISRGWSKMPDTAA